jgi:hypothetical protein
MRTHCAGSFAHVGAHGRSAAWQVINNTHGRDWLLAVMAASGGKRMNKAGTIVLVATALLVGGAWTVWAFVRAWAHTRQLEYRGLLEADADAEDAAGNAVQLSVVNGTRRYDEGDAIDRSGPALSGDGGRLGKAGSDAGGTNGEVGVAAVLDTPRDGLPSDRLHRPMSGAADGDPTSERTRWHVSV